MATSNIQFQQNLTTTIQDLKTEMGQLATTMNQLQSTGFGYLPSQTIVNPKVNAKAIQLPFPTKTVQARKFELDEELLQTFRKMEINIPLLEAIKQIPIYAKFLKELCTHKRKKLNEDVEMGRNKCRDLGTFTVPCTIGDCIFADAMLDLGVSINDNQKLLVIITNNLQSEQEERLLHVLRKHRKTNGWTLVDLPGINPSICIHKILLEEEARLVRQPQRQMNPTILDVVEKEVMKLLSVGIIYPISDNQWVSLVHVVSKKFEMTMVKNQNDEFVPTIIQNSWRVCIDYRKLNQATRKDHFPLPFIDQVLERLTSYMQIHIEPTDQHKTTFTYPFDTFSYTRMSFGLCNTPSTLQRCMIKSCIEIFVDYFTVYNHSFDACLESLSRVLDRCIKTNLVLNFEKCHFMVIEGIVLGHLVSSSSSLHPLDPEIDKTLNRLRKTKYINVGSSSNSFNSISESEAFKSKPDIANSLSNEPEHIENNNKTLKELATPNVLYQPWCIQYP
ncbi:Retrovirus-related Pol polyprotein from transposon 17.6, partial [Mucuna pruriens]